SPVDRRESLRELAVLAEEQLADLDQAVACYRQVQALAPDDLAVARGLSGALRAQGDQEALAESLERELHLDPDPERRGALALEASRLLEQIASRQREAEKRKDGMQRALLLARQACQLEPQDPDPLGTYARVAEKLGRWQELAEVTTRMAGLVDQPSRAGWLYRRAGKIFVQRLNDPQSACKVLLQATEVNPADRDAWLALDPLSEQLDPELHVGVLRRLLQLAEKDAERAQLALRLGRHLERMQRLPEAVEALTLARDRARGPQLLEVLGDLERAYRATERWHDLAVVLGQRGRKLSGEARREAFIERAQILEKKLGRPDRAVETLAHLRDEAGLEERIAHEMERLLAAQGRWEELAQLFEQEARHRGSRGYEALVLLGRLCRDQLDDPERAADALQRAVAVNPKGLGAVEGLRELYKKIERWPELLDTLRLEVTLVKGKTRELRMREAAEVAEDKLGDLATAARYLGEVRELAPHDARVLVALARVQEARGDYKELVETLRRKLSLSDQPREQVVIWQQIGALYAERLDLPTEAVAAQREALALSPNDATSLTALGDLLRALRDYDELVPILQRRAELAQGAEAVALRLEVAEVQAERQGNPDAALATAERVLEDDPRSVAAAKLMARVLRRCDPGSRDPQLATALKRLASLVSGRERSDVLVELAELFVRIGRADSALNALMEAFRADASSRSALDPLAARLAELGRHDELRAVFEQGAAAAESEFSKAELLTKVGQLRFQTGAPDAEAALRQALDLSPSHLPALQGLAQVLASKLEASSDPDVAREVAQLEERAAGQLEHPGLRAAALVRAGSLRRELLGELPLAARRYREALAVDPQSTEALAALSELAYGLGDHKAALPFLERALASPRIAEDPRRGAELAFAQGSSLRELGRREEAAASFRRALSFQLNHVGVLAALATLLQEDGALAAAGAVYRTLIDATRAPVVRAEHQLQLASIEAELGQEDAAIALYGDALRVLPEDSAAHLALGELLSQRSPAESKRHLEFALADPKTEGPARLALADLLMTRDLEGAAAHLRQALDRPGDHRALAARKLAEVQGRAGKWNDAVHNLKRAIELEVDPLRQSELHANLARVLRDRLENRALARRCFESALALNPHERHTLDSLLRLLEQDGDVEGQVKVLGRVIKATQQSGTGDEVALTVDRAELLLKLGQREAAAADYRRVLALQPGHSGALAALSRLCLELGRIEELERIQRTRLASDPLNVSSYRSLFSGYSAAGRDEEAGHALQALAVLRATNEAEAKRIAFSQAPNPKAVLSDAEFSESLLMPELRGPLATLFSKLGKVLLRQVPDDLKQHGIGWRTPRHGLEGRVFPEHPLLKQVCTVLGIRELDVYWMPEHRNPQPVLAHGKVLSLILCPQVFQGLDEPQKAFVLGRALGPVKLGFETLCALDPGQAREVVLGALKALDPGRRFSGDDSRGVRAVIKAVGKADAEGLTTAGELLWSQRNDLEFERLRAAVGLTASRCGMVAAGGVWPASQALVATNLSLGGGLPARTEEVVQALSDQAEFKELLRFAVSADYARVRRRVFGG
ncbi:MAG: tetratricopeptide repeat protein, partial [Planctomycetes bacterium]|nr:tetratricopeptide repeat protein [Planctomycetota bacterium]